jgi:hypothetical protein
MKIFISLKYLTILAIFLICLLFFYSFNFKFLTEKDIVGIFYNIGSKLFSKEGYFITLPSNSYSKFPEMGVGKISKTNFTSFIFLGASGFANKIAAFIYSNTETPKQVFDNFSMLESYYSYETNTTLETISLNITGVKIFKITTFISKNITFMQYGFATFKKNVLFLGTAGGEPLAINMTNSLLEELKSR